MGLRDLHLKLKAFRLRRLLIGAGPSKKRQYGNAKKQSWMTPISHGYHVVEDQSCRGDLDVSDCDSVVVQREQLDEIELWFFGVFDAQVGDSVARFMQSHFFDRKLKPSQIRRKSKDTLKKAYLGARAKARDAEKADEKWRAGSASVMVINGEKLVIANMGEYRAVVCRDGVAHQISSGRQHTAKRHWSRKLFSGTKHSKGSELAVGAEKIDSDTEFVLIASTGIWEVMKNQEAVSLIRHIGDAQEAAECLAKEALTRMSRSNISCVVVRFD
ncbi:hypothetical protein CUMW_204450 [Citrus unshiu]|uniref:PPM-type phosphatase domain-containing protein n=1 Tax=Citrus unshiu TaxID=55188 RepID=A0A2H5Q7Y1_CITUN|nr:hypothetical protein CUMW_204450 [Citrus unshiu]